MQPFVLQAFGNVVLQSQHAAGSGCRHLLGAQAGFFPAFAHQRLQRRLAVRHTAADQVVEAAWVGGLGV